MPIDAEKSHDDVPEDFRKKVEEWRAATPHLAEFRSFLDALNSESHRGAVLISASMLDELLSRTVQAFLLPHSDTKALVEGFNAPIGTFSARILAAFSMGLISDKEYADLGLIRKVRNRFAHDIAVSFDDQQIKDICARFHFSAKDYGDVVIGSHGQFTSAATALILNLTNRPHYVSQERLAWQPWKY